jgi:hypothetical protein
MVTLSANENIFTKASKQANNKTQNIKKLAD